MSAGRVAGKRAIVTGAARGIGAATARRFAADGAKVLLADREPSVAETAAAVGGQALQLDVTARDGKGHMTRVTKEVPMFRDIEPSAMAAVVARAKIVDGRHALVPAQWRAAGWEYRALGRP